MNKLKVLTIGLLLSASTDAQVLASLNTAVQAPGYNSTIPLGAVDASWEVYEMPYNYYWNSPSPPLTGYVSAVCVNKTPSSIGWGTPPYSNANWITYPHASCTSSNSVANGCNANHYCVSDTVGVHQWYRITFTVTCPQICVDMELRADNAITETFINTTSQSGPGYQTQVQSPANNHGWSTPISISACFNQGVNYIIVHVVSRTKPNNNDYDYAGLYAHVNGGTTCTEPPPPSGCCLGNYCSDAKNKLTGDYEISTNGHSFYYSDDEQLSDKVNVGYTCGAATVGKLNAYTKVQTNANPMTDVSPASAGVYGLSEFNGSKQEVTGVFGEARNMELMSKSIGVWGRATGAMDNIGGKFYAERGSRYNIGVSAIAFPSTGNVAPETYKVAYPGNANIGIYAAGEMLNSDPDGSNPQMDWAGWFDGDVNVRGLAYGNGWYTFSDKRLKQNIVVLDNPLEKLRHLSAYRYSYRVDEYKDRLFDNKTHIGLIAQEVKEAYPELVTQDAKGYYAVDYQGMVPVLLEAIKALQQQVDELKAIAKGAQSGQTMTNVVLSDAKGIVLNQNVPNPFAESTVISYSIPDDFASAKIVFSDNSGIVIKTVDITKKGAGNLTVFANDLTRGTYSYALIVDGKLIDSKKMIKE